MKSQLQKTYQDIVSLENLYAAWAEFLHGKSKKNDVREFGLNLSDNLVALHQELVNSTYTHSSYDAFKISDPKPRDIHKAKVRDRVLHHAIYRQMHPFFNKTFIADSYSCQLGKGAHKAVNKFKTFGLKASRNNTKTVWILKCDIKKFFASMNHQILLGVLAGYIPDKNIMWLMEKIIISFDSGTKGTGLPLGNLTSQLFCNIYMNEFDQFVKHKLKAKYYVRYADDFVFFSNSKTQLENLIPYLALFLKDRLRLTLHPDKIFIKTLSSGVDFLGWTHFPDHRVLRTMTKRRAFRGLRKNPKLPVINSYLGLMSHGNAFSLKLAALNCYGLWSQSY
jgi:RNA-directed DNA polymerase